VKRPKKKQHKKAPGAPRRFKTAFIFFSTAKHKEIRQELGSRGSKQKTPNIAKMVGEAWRNLTKEERAAWDEIAAKDKARFELEKSVYKGPWQVPNDDGERNNPKAPRRPCSAFVAFLNSKRSEVKVTHPDASPRDVMRIGAKMWHTSAPEVRARYLELEAQALQKYKKDQKDWRDSKPEVQQAVRREEMAWMALEAQEKQDSNGDEEEQSTSRPSSSSKSRKRKGRKHGEVNDDAAAAMLMVMASSNASKIDKKQMPDSPTSAGSCSMASPSKPDPDRDAAEIKLRGVSEATVVVSSSPPDQRSNEDIYPPQSTNLRNEQMAKPSDQKQPLSRSHTQLSENRVVGSGDRGHLARHLLADDRRGERVVVNATARHTALGSMSGVVAEGLPGTLYDDAEHDGAHHYYARSARQEQKHQHHEARRVMEHCDRGRLASLLLQEEQYKKQKLDQLIALTLLERRQEQEQLALLASSSGTNPFLNMLLLGGGMGLEQAPLGLPAQLPSSSTRWQQSLFQSP